MALYLGNSGRLKINLGGVAYRLNLLSASPVTNNAWLLSSDNYILTDSNGIYLIPNAILSSDNYILTDLNGLYLTMKESE